MTDTASTNAPTTPRRRQPSYKTSLFVDRASWIAGVLDAAGQFDLWQSSETGRWSWRVAIAVERATAVRFEQLAGVSLRRIGAGRYVVKAAEAIALLSRAMPYMFCLHEEAGVVYRYLITRPTGKGMRGPMTKAIAEYRGKLLVRLRTRCDGAR